MEACVLNNLYVIIQKMMSSQNSEEDMIKFLEILVRAEAVIRRFSSK